MDRMNQGSKLVTRGFEAFRRGTMGNAGQNLYVSHAGVLQRIFQFDLNQNGYLDLVFCNSQNHWERPPSYVYPAPLTDPTHRVLLPAEGARSGAVADLSGNGYDDLIVGNHYGGVTLRQNCSIYFGSPEGLSERYRQELPAPLCTSVAAGDFNGNGKTDIAFLTGGRVRIFYQTTIGFEPKRYVDLGIEADQVGAADLDEDGSAELLVRAKSGEVRVHWGGPDGINSKLFSVVPIDVDPASEEEDAESAFVEYVEDASPLVKAICLDGARHLYVARKSAAYLVPVDAASREFGSPRIFVCGQNLSVAAGNIKGNGYTDLLFACREEMEGEEYSWVYWGGPDGYSERHRTRLASFRACDAALGDLDGDGLDEIVISQSKTLDSFTSESLIYHATPDGVDPQPVRLVSEDARRGFLVRASDAALPQVVLINHFSRGVCGDVDVDIYYGGPDGFTASRRRGLPGFGAVEALCCDINDNGFVDVVLANCAENATSRDPGSYIYIGGADGFAKIPGVVLPTVRAHGVCCADLNHNGYLDLVFCGFQSDELLIFYGSENGYDRDNPVRIRIKYDDVVYNDPRWTYLADLNNNGWLDLVVPQIEHDRSFILWGGPDGFSMNRCQALSVFHAACARAADLNGNGYLDLIMGGHTPSVGEPHDTFVCIYWNGPEGLGEDRRTLLPARGTNAMTVADFNNNGLLDLFVCSYHDVTSRDIDSYIYWNRKGRGFSTNDRRRLFTHSASGCVAADFNDNGWTDLAIAYHKVEGDHVGFSAVWRNGADGFDGNRITKLPTTGPHGMTCMEPGNIMDRGPEEFYISEPLQIFQESDPASISWEAEIPPRTWVNAQLRSSTTREGLANAPWSGPNGPESRYENNQAISCGAGSGPWLQYRLALGADKSMRTPRVTQVTLLCRSGR